MGYTIDAWIEYDDTQCDYPERAGEPPFSEVTDNSIPLRYFVAFCSAKDYRFFAAISGIKSRVDDPEPLFPLRCGLPPNVSGYTEGDALQVIEDVNSLGWLTYPEIEQALAHMNVQREHMSFATNLVLDLMRSIEERLGQGHSRLIFHIWY